MKEVRELLAGKGTDDGSLARVVSEYVNLSYYEYDDKWELDGEDSPEICVFRIVEDVVYSARGSSSVEEVNKVMHIVRALNLCSYY
jgi:hypothetical protein